MTEDQQPQTVPEAASVPEPSRPLKTPAVPGAGQVRYPALLESLAALGLLLVVAYACWRLYGAEIANMFAALFQR